MTPDLKSNTPEQSAIISAVGATSSSLQVNALAGTGKTTTMSRVARAIGMKPTLALAFNVKVKEDLEKKLPKWCKVKSFNGLGYDAWLKSRPYRGRIEDKKLQRLCKAFNFHPFGPIIDLVTEARNRGLIVQEGIPLLRLPEGIDLGPRDWDSVAEDLDIDPRYIPQAIELLRVATAEAFSEGVIDFDEQLYLSVFFSGVYPKFLNVLVDESQDLSPINHIQIARCLLPASRIFSFGDRHQAIYAFRGADAHSMDNLRHLRQDWLELPLTTTFRCSRAVVERQKPFVPLFNAWSGAAEGSVSDLRGASWGPMTLRELGGTVAILCRNNAPMIKTALRLLPYSTISVLGRDFGRSLLSVLDKAGCKQGTMTMPEVRKKLQSWLKGKEQTIQRLDQVESIIALIEVNRPADLTTLRTEIDLLYKDRTGAAITLGTGHKAKGLEWDNVIHLDPHLIPNKYAKTPDQLEQEANLKYVIETRPKINLILLSSEDFSP